MAVVRRAAKGHRFSVTLALAAAVRNMRIVLHAVYHRSRRDSAPTFEPRYGQGDMATKAVVTDLLCARPLAALTPTALFMRTHTALLRIIASQVLPQMLTLPCTEVYSTLLNRVTLGDVSFAVYSGCENVSISYVHTVSNFRPL